MRAFENLKNDLPVKMNKYSKKYNSIFFIFVKLIFFSITRILNILMPSFGKNKIEKLPSKVLKIAVCLDGGVGDMLVYAVWLKEFSKIIEGDFIIDVYAHRSQAVSSACFKESTFVKHVFRREMFERNFSKYDLAISFRRFPVVIYDKQNKIKQFSPNLIDFIDHYKKFRHDYDKFFIYLASADTQVDLYTICRGEKRIQQPDIDNLLGISEDTKYYLHINNNAFDILKSCNLVGQKYITITRSVETSQKHISNIRLWPIKYYEKLIADIKNRYPEIKIVQLGVDRCETLKGIDINLLGKTNLEEVKALLKYSLLHIDGECGMVHMKHFLGGVSAVFFAQTAIEYLGYSNNINLKSNGCPHWCEWIVDDWQTHCIRGYEVPPCMTELKPEYVFENITPYLDKVVNKPEKKLDIVNTADINTFLAENNLANLKIMLYGMEYYEQAKKLSKTNSVTLYDSKLENKCIKEAKALGIEMEYADIYNIPDVEDAFDVVCVPFKSVHDNEFMMQELNRVTKDCIVLVEE